MKVTFSILIFFVAARVHSTELVVPENILSSWGYETIESNEEWQKIKRIKGEKWDGNQVYYPSFSLSKICFESTAVAENENKRITEENTSDPSGGFKSHYNGFVSGKCLYKISTAARITFLNYQPTVLTKLKTYVLNQQKP